MRGKIIPIGLALAFCLSGAAIVAEGAPAGASKAEAKTDAKTETKKSKDDGGLFGSADNVVPLPVLIAPVTSKDYLVTHLYLFLAAVTPSAAEANKLKEKMPYVLDGLVMSVYREIASVPSRDAEPDYGHIVAMLKANINQTMGRDIVTEIKIGKIDTAPY